MIVGIALVVDDPRKGQRLVFRYPESVPSFVLNSGENLLRFHDEYLSLTPDQFAKIFRPKAALFNKLLEIEIGDLQYVSFPTNCVDDSLAFSPIESDSDSYANNISMFNVVVALVKQSAFQRLQLSSNIDFNRLGNKSGIDPVAGVLGLQDNYSRVSIESVRKVVENFSKALLVQEQRYRYVSKEVMLMLEVLESLHVQQSHNKSENVGLENVIERAPEEIYDTLEPSDIANTDSANLSTIQSIGLESQESAFDTLLAKREEILRLSSLANELRTVYHSLMGGSAVNLMIDRTISINVKIFSENEQVNQGHEAKSERCRPKVTYDDIKPYHTLLTIAEADDMHEILNKVGNLSPSSHFASSKSTYASDLQRAKFEVSPGIEDVIFAANPTVPLHKLAKDLDIPFDELRIIVEIICQSGLGEIVTVLNAENIYQVHPNAPLAPFSKVAMSFASAFYPLYLMHTNNLTSPIASSKSNASCGSGSVDMQLLGTTISTNKPRVSILDVPGNEDSKSRPYTSYISPCSSFSSKMNSSSSTFLKIEPVDLDKFKSEVMHNGNSLTGNSNSMNGNMHQSSDVVVSSDVLLSRILACFDGYSSLENVIDCFPEGLKTQSVDIILWLLRWHMIRELHIFLLDTSMFQEGYYNNSAVVKDSRKLSDRKIQILELLKPYLNGKKSLDEFMWNTNISKKHLLSLVNKQKHLVVSIRCKE